MLKNQYGFQMHEVIITGIRTETSTTKVNVVITNKSETKKCNLYFIYFIEYEKTYGWQKCFGTDSNRGTN